MLFSAPSLLVAFNRPLENSGKLARTLQPVNIARTQRLGPCVAGLSRD